MNKTTVARRYAKALFDLLDKPQIDSARQGLSVLCQALDESTTLKHICASPVFTMDEKYHVLTALSDRAGAPAPVKDFLRQLLKKNRLGVLTEITQAFGELADDQEGKQQIFVTTAQSLSPEEQAWLQAQLGALIPQQVELIVQSNPSLLAGLQIRIGSTVYDSSVRGQLDNMRSLLVKG